MTFHCGQSLKDKQLLEYNNYYVWCIAIAEPKLVTENLDAAASVSSCPLISFTAC